MVRIVDGAIALRVLVTGVMLFALVGFAAAASAPTTIAVLHGATAVESYGGVTVWSDYDATARSWHVVVSRNGAISMPPIPTARKAIEVDVGPGPSGAPMLAYVNCTSSCQVVVSGVDGSAPQTVPGSLEAKHPTIWGDRVAWVSGKAKVMISRLDEDPRGGFACPEEPAESCVVRLSEPFAFKPSRAPVHVP